MDTIIELIGKYPECGLEKLKEIYRPGINDKCLDEQLRIFFSAETPPLIKKVYYEEDALYIEFDEYKLEDTTGTEVAEGWCTTRMLQSPLNAEVIWNYPCVLQKSDNNKV